MSKWCKSLRFGHETDRFIARVPAMAGGWPCFIITGVWKTNSDNRWHGLKGLRCTAHILETVVTGRLCLFFVSFMMSICCHFSVKTVYFINQLALMDPQTYRVFGRFCLAPWLCFILISMDFVLQPMVAAPCRSSHDELSNLPTSETPSLTAFSLPP